MFLIVHHFVRRTYWQVKEIQVKITIVTNSFSSVFKKYEKGAREASYVKVVVGSGMPTIALTVLTLTLLNLTFRFWRFDFFRVVKVRFCHYFVFKIVSCSRGRVVMKLFSLLQTLEGKILLWRKPL